MPAVASTALATSMVTVRRAGSWCSTRGAAISGSADRATFTYRHQRQPRAVVSTPPRTRPTANPAVSVAVKTLIALVRSSGEPQDRQKGLSQFIVDLALPGVTVRPIRDLTGDAHFSEVFFDNVLLADDALIGNEGSGWAQVNAELAFERSGPERVYSSIVLLEHWITCLRKTPAASVQAATVGRFATHLATLRNMSIAVTAKLVNGESPLVEAALVKDIGTEFEQRIPAVIEAAIAMDPDALVDAELYRAVAYVSQIAPTYSLRGGTREILRGMIARGLGLR